MTNEKTNRVNLLEIEELSNEEWFDNFEELDDPLTKCLLLVAVLTSHGLINAREAVQFKTFLMQGVHKGRNSQIITSFLRSKSLFVIRSEMRGHLGLPRMRRSDSKA